MTRFVLPGVRLLTARLTSRAYREDPVVPSNVKERSAFARYAGFGGQAEYSANGSFSRPRDHTAVSACMVRCWLRGTNPGVNKDLWSSRTAD